MEHFGQNKTFGSKYPIASTITDKIRRLANSCIPDSHSKHNLSWKGAFKHWHFLRLNFSVVGKWDVAIESIKSKKQQLQKITGNKLPPRFKLFLHRGVKYICPFCNYTSNSLLPMGHDVEVLREKQVIGGNRRRCKCYKCGSTDRERLIYIYLREKVRIFSSDKTKSILHISPEKNLSQKIIDFGFSEYVCGDLFAEGYKYPEHVQKIDVLDIPYSDNTFDVIICNHVLEHIPSDLLAIKELRRVLKRGKQAILQVPISKNSEKTFEDFSVTDPEQRKKIFGQFDHVRIYGQDYIKRLEEGGFKVTRANISKEFMKYGLNKDEDIFVCEK